MSLRYDFSLYSDALSLELPTYMFALRGKRILARRRKGVVVDLPSSLAS